MRDERRLARRAARGDRDAFTTIFRRFQQDLYRYCVAILGNPEDAQDALQNTMVKALGALPGERREIELKPWLYRIAHNESIELIRRRRQTASLDEHELPAGMALQEEVETRQRLRQLLIDVGELPERQRGALLMREAGGLKFEEIATALGTSPPVARQTVYEARLGLREMDAGRNMECTAVTKALSDGDRRVRRRRDITAHLKACPGCRLFAEEMDSRRRALASISPLPVPVAAALLQGLGGGGAGAGSGVAGGAGAGSTGGIGGALGTGVGKSIGTTALIKGAASIAAAAAIGVGGADVTGVLHTAPHEAGSKARTGSVGRRSEPDNPRAAALAAVPVSADRTASERILANRPSPARLAGGERRPPGSPPSPAAPSSVGAAAVTTTPAVRDQPGRPIARPGDGATTAAPAAPAELADGAGRPPQLPPSSAQGQETAAANAGKTKPGSSSNNSEEEGDASPPTAPGHPEHPAHPEHPEHPAKPSDPEPTEAPQSGATATVEAESLAASEESPPGQSGVNHGQEKRDEP